MVDAWPSTPCMRRRLWVSTHPTSCDNVCGNGAMSPRTWPNAEAEPDLIPRPHCTHPHPYPEVLTTRMGHPGVSGSNANRDGGAAVLWAEAPSPRASERPFWDSWWGEAVAMLSVTTPRCPIPNHQVNRRLARHQTLLDAESCSSWPALQARMEQDSGGGMGHLAMGRAIGFPRDTGSVLAPFRAWHAKLGAGPLFATLGPSRSRVSRLRTPGPPGPRSTLRWSAVSQDERDRTARHMGGHPRGWSLEHHPTALPGSGHVSRGRKLLSWHDLTSGRRGTRSCGCGAFEPSLSFPLSRRLRPFPPPLLEPRDGFGTFVEWLCATTPFRRHV